MNGMLLLVAATSVGIDFGWEPGDDGQLEYIIQIEPSLLEVMKSGAVLSSEVFPDAPRVRRFRIQVGTDALPREGGTPAPAEPPLGLRAPTSFEERAGAGASIIGEPPPQPFTPDTPAQPLANRTPAESGLCSGSDGPSSQLRGLYG